MLAFSNQLTSDVLVRPYLGLILTLCFDYHLKIAKIVSFIKVMGSNL